MALALGVDVQDYCDVALALDKFGARYLNKIMNMDEWPQATWRCEQQVRYTASHFAAKEAIFKLLEVNDVVPGWRDIEIDIARGVCVGVTLRRDAHELAREEGISEISLSLAVGLRSVTAVAIAQTFAPNTRTFS